jgi:hypothetical protein
MPSPLVSLSIKVAVPSILMFVIYMTRVDVVVIIICSETSSSGLPDRNISDEATVLSVMLCNGAGSGSPRSLQCGNVLYSLR